jgi:hypothetical protein
VTLHINQTAPFEEFYQNMKILSAFEFYVRVNKENFGFESAKGASPFKIREYVYKTKYLSGKYEKFTYEWM